MNIIFNNQHPTIQIPNTAKLQEWLIQAIENESYILGKLNYTFLSDGELHQINMEFLNHDTFTDIITFDYNRNQVIIGEIYISLDRVSENADQISGNFDQELYRIIIHGLLHLMGYKDKSPEHKIEMTTKEDYYLSLRP